MNEHANNVPDPILQWVVFRLDREIYGVSVLQVQEVLRAGEITPVPAAPPMVLGIINLRGNIVTVIDTRRLLRLPGTGIDDHSRIIIVEHNRQIAGLLVDAVTEVVELKASEIEPTPQMGEEGSKCFQGVCSREGELLILIDLPRLLSAISPAGVMPRAGARA